MTTAKTYKYQSRIFNATKKHRFIVIPKGRQTGLTYAGALNLCRFCLENNNSRYLWGDTIHSNIIKYVERYFIPMLKNIFVGSEYRWDKINKCLYIGNSYIDFRSADNPMNWEGFNYDGIFLNEAGIILRNPYIYNNAVMPMMLRNNKSWVIAAGTPKGKQTRGEPSLFYELQRAALDDTSGDYYTETITTYQCPDLANSDIDRLLKTIPSSVIKQEIYGEFIDSGTALLSRSYIQQFDGMIPDGSTYFMGVDLAISQKTNADYNGMVVIAKTPDKRLIIVEVVKFKDTFANIVSTIVNCAEKWNVRQVFIENVQFQAAVVQEVRKGLIKKNSSVLITGVRPDKDKITRFYGLMAQYEALNVWHWSKGSGLQGYEAELLSFPYGQHDDMVDAAVYAYLASSKAVASISFM